MKAILSLRYFKQKQKILLNPTISAPIAQMVPRKPKLPIAEKTPRQKRKVEKKEEPPSADDLVR